MNTKEKSTASTSQTKEPTVDEKKLSAYSLALCKEIKKVFPYISNAKVAKGLAKALTDYLTAYKKLGGKL
jgi:hypothetical protein